MGQMGEASDRGKCPPDALLCSWTVNVSTKCHKTSIHLAQDKVSMLKTSADQHAHWKKNTHSRHVDKRIKISYQTISFVSLSGRWPFFLFSDLSVLINEMKILSQGRGGWHFPQYLLVYTRQIRIKKSVVFLGDLCFGLQTIWHYLSDYAILIQKRQVFGFKIYKITKKA